ncbi:MAG: sigma-70 family RNA polymerase sigma factor [Planctomycetota bacterium]
MSSGPDSFPDQSQRRHRGSGDDEDRHADDQRLMSLVQAGDFGAFDQLYARYSRPLMNFFYQMCFDRTASEDYLQETFFRVWRARATYRPIGKVSTWLFQIAKNYWLNEREKLKRRPFNKATGGDHAAGWGDVADSSRSAQPTDAARAHEVEEAIRAATGELSEKLRLVFVLARHQGLAYAEISRVLDIPVGTVKSRMALAEKNLRRSLRPFLEGDA